MGKLLFVVGGTGLFWSLVLMDKNKFLASGGAVLSTALIAAGMAGTAVEVHEEKHTAVKAN